MNISRNRLVLPSAILSAAISYSSLYAPEARAQDADLSEIESFFEGANIIAGPTIVDCTLSGGTETSCFSITFGSEANPFYDMGPYCPRNVSDGPDVSGLWIDEGEVYDSDGEFMSNLAEFYQDDFWEMVDLETGEIDVTVAFEDCEIAAQPTVEEQYLNYCVECAADYFSDYEHTYVIPFEPVEAETASTTDNLGSGVAYSGVFMDGLANLNAILEAYTIAPFDDCGGHVNPGLGYHHHAATDCLTDAAENDGHSSIIGIALDGHNIYSHQNIDGSEPDDLDDCKGHQSDDQGYHYHAGTIGSNEIVSCLIGEYGCHSVNGEEDAICDSQAEYQGR